ncbi:hypothetical protein ACEWY4_017284 [Coilia grayii]|uniref:Ig-like domain-containing protein n=1 Tax=Coilia grayii TaxID=363190 RepID=A0ABD1JGE6_9TELE
MSCSFTYPPKLTVTKVFWTIKLEEGKEPPDLSDYPGYKGRVFYSEDFENNCTMTLKDVQLTDARVYHTRIVSNNTKQKWLAKPGLNLNVTGLSVWIPRPVIQGRDISLSCNTSCRLKDNDTITWRKDGEDLPATGINSVLILANVTTQDEGDYSCALEGRGGHPSQPVNLNVMFAPRNTSVSVSPSTEVPEGGSVTLTCSSDADPTVESYTWFKVNQSTTAGSGQQYSISNISSENGGQYYCEARNEHGAENSSSVSVTVIVIVKGTINTLPMPANSHCVFWPVQSRSPGPSSAEAAGQEEDDDQYSTIQPHCSRETTGAQDDDVQYSTLQPHCFRETAAGQEDDVQYSTIQPHCSRETTGAQGYSVQGRGGSDDDVQYPTIQPHCQRGTRDTEQEQEEEVHYITLYLPQSGQWIETNKAKDRWIGKPGITLQVTDIRVASTNGRVEVEEGGAITLTCKTTCNLTGSTSFIWSKDGRPVGKKQSTSNQLQLHPVSREDEGSYTCAVRGHEELPSPPFKLQVMHGQRTLLYVLLGVAVCVAIAVICAVMGVRRFCKNHRRREESTKQKENKGPSSHIQTPAPALPRANQAENDVEYCSIHLLRAGRSRAAGPSSVEAAGAAEDDVQYSTVQPHCSRETTGGREDDDVQYSTIQPQCSRETTGGREDDDVQYSTIQPQCSRETTGARGDDVQYASVHLCGNTKARSGAVKPIEDDRAIIYSSVAQPRH